MEIKETLKRIGLNESEIKVYLALLRLGDTKKSEIIKESGIAHSKIYVNLDKLIDKGLVGTIKKDRTSYYFAAPLDRIKDFLEEKKKKLEEDEKLIDKILPELTSFQKKKHTPVELFSGWKGLETVYTKVLENTKSGEEIFILGASRGYNEEQTKNFFHKYSLIARRNKLRIKIIFDETSKDYVFDMEKEAKTTYQKKFLGRETTTEIFISSNYVGIVMLKETPIIVLLKDKETSRSLIQYFEQLWKIAKP